MSVQRERVHGEGEAEEVEVLAGVSDAVGASEPHGVVEVAVDGFGVVAAGEEPFEVGVAGRDGPEVLGPVELPSAVVVVAVETDRDHLVLVACGELVVVVPAVAAALVPVAVRPDAGEAGVLDKLASDLFLEALPGASAHLNLYYWQEVDGKRVRYEADALVLFEDVVISLEGKGGPLSVQAQRGDLVRASRDLRKSMEEAWYQSARVRDYIVSRKGSTADFEDEHGDVVLQIDPSKVSEVLLVNPTMHAFRVFALQIPALRELGLFDADHGEPWSVFINDLRVIVEMIRTPAELLHFIRWRSQLEIGTKLIATDELDIFGEYLFGLTDWESDEIDYVRVVNATVDFDAYYSGVLDEGPPRDPPHKIRGQTLEAFLADLANSRPRGWLRRSFALLDMPLEEAAWVEGWLDRRALADLFGEDSAGFRAEKTLVVALAADVSWMDVAFNPDYSTRGVDRLIVVRNIGGRFALVSAESLR